MADYSLKGFVTIKSLIDNAVGQTSILGEASTYSLTFTKERGEYSNALYPNFSLVSVSSKDTSGAVVVNTTVADHVLDVVNHTYAYAFSASAQIFADQLLLNLVAAYGTQATNFECGPIINGGTIWLPEWMSWKTTAADPESIKIWFSDEAFKAQFDEFAITVISPMARIVGGNVVDNLDNFFMSPADVAIRINGRSASETTDIIQQLKDMNPETIIRTDTYNYSNPVLPAFIVPTNWTVLIYGAAGDNPDSVKDAIVEYVLANSTHTIDEWKVILPELFRRTEFVFFPRWDIYAIPNSQVIAGIHRPLVKLNDSFTFVESKLPEYMAIAPTHIRQYLTSFTHVFKSIGVLCIGGFDNTPLPTNLRRVLWDEFPDYIMVGTSSPDFGRMTQRTQEFSVMLSNLIISAETVTQYSAIPAGMRKVTRDGVIYMVQRYENVQYMVAGKVNYPPLPTP